MTLIHELNQMGVPRIAFEDRLVGPIGSMAVVITEGAAAVVAGRTYVVMANDH